MKSVFDIKGMFCSNCALAVEKATKKVDGVENVQVNLMTNSMVCEYSDPSTTKKICESIKKAGYKAKARNNSDESKDDSDDEYKKTKTRLWVSVGIMIPLMIVSMGHMYPKGFFLHEFAMNAEYAGIFSLTLFIPTIFVIFLNRIYYIRGVKALFSGNTNMDTLVSLGSGASLLYGIYEMVMINIYLGLGYAQTNPDLVTMFSRNLYFEGAAMILTLVTVGKTLEARAKGKTNNALNKLNLLKPAKVNIMTGDEEITVDISELKTGDIFVVRPGENIPADGVIVKGESTLDQSALTGESIPVDKREGDRVISASTNLNGIIYVKAEKVGDDTTLSKIISLVEQAGATKSKSSRLADKISKVFVPVVSGISLITLIIWLIVGKDFQFALNMSISVLVISCPCALGLATPVAVTAAVGRSASKGVLVKSAEIMEELSISDVIVFDKTGTLTCGETKLTEFETNIDRDEFLKISATLESGSEHPLSKAVTQSYNNDLYELSDFKAVFGRGVCGNVDSIFTIAGNKEYMEESGISLGDFEDIANNYSKNGETSIFVARDGKILGVIAVADVIREDSKKTIENIKNFGKKVVMITGDNALVANAIKEKLGIDECISGVLPHEKAKEIEKMKNEGLKVVMVGDGINDSPALTLSDVGIAMGSGSDIAIDSADIIILNNDIKNVYETLKFSKSVQTNIKENLFWAFFYNVIGIPIAAGALYTSLGISLNPMIASLCMSFSSIFVVLNALRLYKK